MIWVCSSAGRAAVSKAAGRGFESLRTRLVSFNQLLVEVCRKLKSLIFSSQLLTLEVCLNPEKKQNCNS